MDRARARGTSLWLMPEGAVRERLAAIVARQAARFGTEAFAPHVTLLPGVEDPEAEVCSASRILASTLRPFPVRLRGIEGRDEHFRCLFVRAEAKEPLRAAHAAAARAFRRAPDPTFLPHLSLVYGTLPPHAKESLAGELAGQVDLEFEALHLHVWQTEGRVSAWREIGCFHLSR